MRIGDWGTMLKFAKPHNGSDFSDGDDDQLFISPSHMTPSPAVGAGDAPQPTPIVLPDEAVEAQAANAQSGPGGPGSVVALTSGGITINLIFPMAAPASFRAGIQQAASMLTPATSSTAACRDRAIRSTSSIRAARSRA